MGACTNAGGLLAAAGLRLCSSVASPPILVACALERLPVVLPASPAWETEYKEWSIQRRMQQGFFKTYPEKATRSRTAGLSAQQQSEDEEEGKRQFNPVPRIIPADTTGNKRTMKRKLEEKVFLLLKHKDQWSFPHLAHQQGQSIREAAEAALKHHLAEPAPVYFIGNAPMAHYQTTEGTLFFMCAQVRQDPWEVQLQKQAKVQDFAWVTKDELHAYIKDEKMVEIARLML